MTKEVDLNYATANTAAAAESSRVNLVRGRIAINGARGHIGSVLSQALKDCGFRVEPLYADVRDPAFVANELGRLVLSQANKPDLVIHCAAMVNTDVCRKAPHEAHAINAAGSYNVAVEAARFGLPLLHFSTTATFDPRGPQPFTAESRCDPQTVYGITKLSGELNCRDVYRRYPSALCVVKPCFVYGGPNDVSNIGAMVRSHAAKKLHVTQLDRRRLKDWIHVTDFSSLVCAVVEDFFAHGRWFAPTIVVAAGEPRPFSDVLSVLEAKGRLPDYLAENPLDDYLGDHVCDGSPTVALWESMRKMEFQPKTLEEGIELLVDEFDLGARA